MTVEWWCLAAAALLSACSSGSTTARDSRLPEGMPTAAPGRTTGRSQHRMPVAGAVERVEVPPPPFDEGLFPCSSCHASRPADRTPRELVEMHGEITLAHGEPHRWCLDCHEAANRDVLHLAGGQLVPFDESYRLCGQCHGEKLQDWRAGVHGRRSGEWNGRKTYLLCAHCHDPHRPRFAPIRPEPPPQRPRPGLPFTGGRRGR